MTSSSLPRLHLVGGFLGSGKTTAISMAAKSLAAHGQRVGILTNDQGKYLVDTAFARSLDLPALEVSGGCFCCRLDDFKERLSALIDIAQPQVIFAESVGSCADLVATVVKPLLAAARGTAVVNSLSVFADARLLLRHVRGQELPFSERITYLFGQQLMEAGLIVANKIDLLSEHERALLSQLLASAYPGKPVRLQNSLLAEEVQGWLSLCENGQAAPPLESLDIDYTRYADGETRLAWLDARLSVESSAVGARFMQALLQALRAQAIPIGHVKALFSNRTGAAVKLSQTGADDLPNEATLLARLAILGDGQVDVLLNARAECSPEQLRQVLDTAIRQARVGDASVTLLAAEAFSPGQPHPTERVI